MADNRFLIDSARRMRREPTHCERVLWRSLRDRRFDGLKFRRQQPIGPFVADFFCPAVGVIVELDGEPHLSRTDEDHRRQRWLEERGFVVLRFWNSDLLDNADRVLDRIWNVCRSRIRSDSSPLTPDPSPSRGEGGSSLP